MTLDPGLLEEAIRSRDALRVRALLRDATEADRRACAKALADLLEGPGFPMRQPVLVMHNMPEGMRAELEEMAANAAEEMAKKMAGARQKPAATEQEYFAWRNMSQTSAFVAAAVGLAGGRKLAAEALDHFQNFWNMPAVGHDVIAGVLADRNPEWLSDLVQIGLTARFPHGVNGWLLARRLVRLGAIDRPDIPEYTTQMPAWLTSGVRGHRQSPLEALLADPELLDDEVWRLFTVPGAVARLDRWDEGEWSAALAALAERGMLDRGRLLDACLDAFVRDFAPNTVGWYLKFHDRLSPDFAEIALRSGRYLALLAAASKPGVSLGQRACGTLLDAGAVSAEVFLAASGPALVFPQKSVATAQLKLIGKIAAGQPTARDLALVTAAQAFGHIREDVQQAALKLIAKHGVPADPAARASIINHAAALSPTLAPDAVALGLVPGAVALGLVPGAVALGLVPGAVALGLVPGAVALGLVPGQAAAAGTGAAPSGTQAPGAGPAPAAIPRSPAAAPAISPPRSVPVTDPAELIQLLAQLMEDASDILAVERAMAGAVRLASLPVAERTRLAAPIFKRAARRAEEDWVGPFSGHQIRADIAWLTGTWATGLPPVLSEHRGWGVGDHEEVLRSGAARTMAGILSARIWEACALIAAENATPLLAEPEFADGTISHGQLLDRLALRGEARQPGYDLEVALLRLAPGADEEFWAQWARLDKRSAPQARRAYSEGLAPLELEPWAGEIELQLMPSYGVHSVLAPGMAARLISGVATASARPASHSWRLLTYLDNPVHAQHSRRTHSRVYMDEVVAAWPLLCPHQPELIAAHLLRPLSDGLQPGPSAATVAVSGLAPAGRPFGPVGHLALAAGVASAEPDTRITAAGVLTRTALDGRLDPELLASAIALGVTGQAVKVTRVADGLRHALAEPAAAVSAARAAAAATAALLPAKPAGLHELLEVACRSAATPGAAGAVPVPPPIADLAASRDRTKLAEAARRLVRLTEPG